jgi:uncharacterized protein (DUF885 family)
MQYKVEFLDFPSIILIVEGDESYPTMSDMFAVTEDMTEDFIHKKGMELVARMEEQKTKNATLLATFNKLKDAFAGEKEI